MCELVRAADDEVVEGVIRAYGRIAALLLALTREVVYSALEILLEKLLVPPVGFGRVGRHVRLGLGRCRIDPRKSELAQMLRLAFFVGGDEDYPNVKADARQIIMYDRCIF